MSDSVFDLLEELMSRIGDDLDIDVDTDDISYGDETGHDYAAGESPSVEYDDASSGGDAQYDPAEYGYDADDYGYDDPLDSEAGTSNVAPDETTGEVDTEEDGPDGTQPNTGSESTNEAVTDPTETEVGPVTEPSADPTTDISAGTASGDEYDPATDWESAHESPTIDTEPLTDYNAGSGDGLDEYTDSAAGTLGLGFGDPQATADWIYDETTGAYMEPMSDWCYDPATDTYYNPVTGEGQYSEYSFETEQVWHSADLQYDPNIPTDSLAISDDYSVEPVETSMWEYTPETEQYMAPDTTIISDPASGLSIDTSTGAVLDTSGSAIGHYDFTTGWYTDMATGARYSLDANYGLDPMASANPVQPLAQSGSDSITLGGSSAVYFDPTAGVPATAPNTMTIGGISPELYDTIINWQPPGISAPGYQYPYSQPLYTPAPSPDPWFDPPNPGSPVPHPSLAELYHREMVSLGNQGTPFYDPYTDSAP